MYLQVIKDLYLGNKWQLRMNIQFENRAFRQPGFEHESPQQFLGRRIKAVRTLANSDDGRPLEVFLVMRKAPIKWRTILVIENIPTTEELYKKVNEHDDSLLDAVKNSPTDVVTLHNIASTLRRLGFQQASSSRTFKRANRTEVNEELDNPQESSAIAAEVQGEPEEDGEVTLKQVYQTLKKRQRPPPKGGYPFAKNDHVTTKMGRAPPFPCKVCGSANHWDRECPDWNVYIEKQKRGVLVLTASPAAEETELMYHSAYCVLLEGRVSEPSF
jgi:signal recognition particle subunit SEC65